MKKEKKTSYFYEKFKTTLIYDIYWSTKKCFTDYKIIITSAIFISFAAGILLSILVFNYRTSLKNSQTAFMPITETDYYEKIYVTVAGEVLNPGLYEMTTEDRVNDVIEKAGGFTENAYTENVNLSQKLSDEQYIKIITKAQAISDNTINTPTNFHKIVNINTATKEQLTEIPGIGDVTAGRIIEYRNKVGTFQYIDEIKNIKGISDSTFNEIKPYITV